MEKDTSKNEPSFLDRNPRATATGLAAIGTAVGIGAVEGVKGIVGLVTRKSAAKATKETASGLLGSIVRGIF